MKAAYYKRCGCKDPNTGKHFDRKCPNLPKSRHGTWTFDTRIDTTKEPDRRFRRAGYSTKTKAEKAFGKIEDLIKLAGADTAMAARIGDLIVERSKNGGELPEADEIRRRLGAGTDLDAPTSTVAEWLEEWYAGKRGKKATTLKGWRQHLDHYLIPLLGGIPRDKLRVEHIAGLFDTIEEWNTEIIEARQKKRAPYLPDDKRKRHQVVGIATQHRILATLRNAYNVAVRRPGMLDWNPCLAIELPPERRDPARIWSPEQVTTFLHAAAQERLGLLYRIILLRGPRRGEACGIRWQDLDDDDTGVTIVQTVLQISGKIVWDTPKTASGSRWVSFDDDTTALIEVQRRRQHRERMAAGDIWQDHDLMICKEDGSPLSPDWISRYFKILAERAGLPPIKLHEARHTAATIALEAGIDIKVVSDQLGHSKVGITQDLYTHVRKAVHDQAAAEVIKLLGRDTEHEDIEAGGQAGGEGRA